MKFSLILLATIESYLRVLDGSTPGLTTGNSNARKKYILQDILGRKARDPPVV